MTQKIIKCGLIGGLILFVWSLVSWTVLPWQKGQINAFKSESDVRSAIMDNAPVSGLYVLPNLHQFRGEPERMEAAKARMMAGPYVFASVSLDGKSPNMMGPAIVSLIMKIVAACLVAWLLFHIPRDYNKSVKFVTVIGIVIAILSVLPFAVWFGFPAAFTIGTLIEIIFGWFFAGLAMAKLAK